MRETVEQRRQLFFPSENATQFLITHAVFGTNTYFFLFHFGSEVLIIFLAECIQILSGCSFFGFPNSVLGAILNTGFG